MDLRTEIEQLCRDWREEIAADYFGTDPIDVYTRAQMMSMVRQVEARLTWTEPQSPAAREAGCADAVPTSADGENKK